LSQLRALALLLIYKGSFQRLAGYNSMASTKLALYRDFRQAGEIGGFKEDCMVMKWDGGE
jgi:hypothetical protein